jgi:acyl-[acyl-carrier-protein]-phospholipid O-acyltransferase/long-chain-fatty-acid--[acyl-carrier-protein] ligase
VVARADHDKGERLVLVCNDRRLELREVREVLKAKGHSNLCVPRELLFVKEIPKLGTGKVDHRELVRQMMETE